MNAITERPRIRTVIDLVAIVALLLVPVIGFAPTFDSPLYLVGGLGGIVLGVGIAVLGAWRRWGILPLAGLVAAAYFVLGGALALPQTALGGVIPTLETWRLLALGVTQSWKELLTTVPPVAATDGHMIVPFLLSLVTSVLASSLALRVLPAAWALVPALAYLVTAIALGATQPIVPVVQGILFAVVAVSWLAVRQHADQRNAAVSLGGDDRPNDRALVRRLATAGVVLVVASGFAVATNAVAAPTGPRYVLRDIVIPPFDVRQYPSPLQSFRGHVRDAADEMLVDVSGLPEDGRVRLGVMDAYNGIVYNVSDGGAGSSGAFTPLRSNMSPDAEGTPATLRFEVGGLGGVWLPDAGHVREILFDGPRAEDLRRSTFYNDATGTAVTTVGLQPGDAYTIETVFPVIPSDEALADVAFAPVALPAQENVPEGLTDAVDQALAEASTPIERARALEAYFSQDGFFSHGLEGQPFSPAGHGAARIASLIGGDQMVGDDEQYAVAMALAARDLGIPARVVMGWHIGEDEQRESVLRATGDNLHAWVEIAFDGYGWLPFDPTPSEDQVPNDQTTRPQADPRPQVLQPPPPPQEPADLPPTIADDRDAQDEEEPGAAWLIPVLVAVLSVLGVLLLLAAPFIVVGALKAARRARRRRAERPADRISGGWDELVDRAVDFRATVDTGATRPESAAVVSETFAQPSVVALADRADAQVFGPGEPAPEVVDDFWREVDDIVGGMRDGASPWARLRARISVRSLTGRPRRPSAIGHDDESAAGPDADSDADEDTA